jgi:hypothetical protein
MSVSFPRVINSSADDIALAGLLILYLTLLESLYPPISPFLLVALAQPERALNLTRLTEVMRQTAHMATPASVSVLSPLFRIGSTCSIM